MKKNIIVALTFISCCVIITSCRKKAFDEYYGRPDNLAQPIYQQLQAKGNFTNLLACIDKAKYKDILSAAGYWTIFAPNDKAFQKFFTDRGIAGVDQIDSGTAAKIVTYCLVYNAFPKAKIGDYQSSAGWVPSMAFKRRTAYYTGFYKDTTIAGKAVTAIAANRNAGYVVGDNNNKYIPYFVDNFVAKKGITSSDYTYFYPTSSYTGFNVMDASVVTPDIVAENGYVHEIDRVLMPLPSIDQYLASNPQYSEFKKLFDKYMVSFNLSNDATNKYKLLTGANDNVYLKMFNAGLAYSPNNENYLKLQDNDGQSDGWTMFAPTNQVLLDYINSVLLENYKSLDVIPQQVIIDFLNAHLYQTSVWPSKFAVTNNFQAEPPTMNSTSDIVDKKILSNGFFYGTSKVQQANVFRTVYGRAYLDPNYSLMTRALDQNYRYVISVPSLRYTIFMMSDQVLRAKGYDWNVAQSQWQYTTPGTATVTISNAVRDMVQRILATHIVLTPNNELNNLAGSGIIETINGEYIKWNAGKLSSAGTLDSNYVVNTLSTKSSYNGLVYYTDNLLNFSTNTLGNNIKKLGAATTSQFNYFYQFLSNSALFNATTGDILGVQAGVFYTALIPNNAAIQAAVTAGLLPKNANGTPNFAPTAQPDVVLVTNFILYHLLNKNTIIPDGKKTGAYETVFKKLLGDPGQVTIASSPGSMQITDNYGRTANVIVASSNNLADRCVIHLIDNYLQYNPN
ncbi:fasciclin domain-containing protein [Chitinophagaceae bacterium LWZ2-11]